MRQVVFDFLWLHALQARLKIPDIAHRQREALGDSEVLTRLLNDLLPRALHGWNGRFAFRRKLPREGLHSGPVKRSEQKSGRDRSAIGNPEICIGERQLLQIQGGFSSLTPETASPIRGSSNW